MKRLTACNLSRNFSLYEIPPLLIGRYEITKRLFFLFFFSSGTDTASECKIFLEWKRRDIFKITSRLDLKFKRKILSHGLKNCLIAALFSERYLRERVCSIKSRRKENSFLRRTVQREEITRIGDSSFLCWSYAREQIEKRKIKTKGREKEIKRKILATSHAIRRSLSRDQLYQRLRLYANGRRLISIMNINLFFFS